MKERLFDSTSMRSTIFHVEQRETKLLENSPRTMPFFHLHLIRFIWNRPCQPDSHVCNCKLFIVPTTFHFPPAGEEFAFVDGEMSWNFQCFSFFHYSRIKFDKIYEINPMSIPLCLSFLLCRIYINFRENYIN